MQFLSSRKEFHSLSIYPREADSESCRRLTSLWSSSKAEEVLYYHKLMPTAGSTHSTEYSAC